MNYFGSSVFVKLFEFQITIFHMDDFNLNSNFLIRQIIVGNVQLDAQPSKENVPVELRHLDFVSAKCSITLIEHLNGPMKMLVDCGSPFEREILIQALKANGIADPSQITHLVISHWHIDHCGQIGLFPNVKLITPELVRDGKGKIGTEFGLPNGIQFAFHVGHSCGDLVVKVRQKRMPMNNAETENERTVTIVGDLFEFQNDWMGDEPWKGVSQFPDRQALARWICWKEADWIVPGHGPAFATKCSTNLTMQTPIYGKILFDSDSMPIVKSKGAEKLANVKEILKFRNDNSIYRIHLIKAGKSNILVNCGGLAQRLELIKALHFQGRIGPNEISHLIVTHPEEQLITNLDLFNLSTIFLCHDIAIPGPFYATLDHQFISLEDGILSVWCDLRTNSTEKCTLSVLMRVDCHQNFVLISEQIDQFILTKLEIQKEKIKLIKPIVELN